MSRKPFIGIPVDSQEPGGYSKYPWYALRKNYCAMVVEAGGVPLMLPHHPELVDIYADQVDGLLIPGGGFDIPPSFYGDETVHDKVTLRPERTNFELAITKKIHGQGKPILGICGGMQLINVVFGGTLIQHIPDEVPNCLEHEQTTPRNEPAHTIDIVPGTLLHRLASSEISMPVNSVHHQAVKKVAPDLIVNATASDGVIEGIEHRDQTQFIFGIQWHPEFHITALDRQIFEHFVGATKRP